MPENLTANYVKFLRGTWSAYNALSSKNEDTLYFLSEDDSKTGKLYLGEKLISDTTSQKNIAKALGELFDVDTAGVTDKQVLAYDAQQQKWIPMSIEALIQEITNASVSIMDGATANQDGKSGIVPAPKAGEQEKFLRGDGTWAEVPASGQVFTGVLADGQTQDDAIQAMVGSAKLAAGDIAIVKELINGDKYQYTAYAYDGANWAAMDGNYSAENVYFKEDLVTTTAIGNISLSNGQATISAAGKNLKQVFDTIFVKEKNPSITQPKASITLTGAGAKEVGTTFTPAYSASLTTGSYTYGPSTGITATSYSVTESEGGESSDTASGSFEAFTVEEDTNYKVSVSITHGAGTVPVTNTGNAYAAGQIAAGTKTASSSSVTGYRAWFSGYKAEGATISVADITSEQIRALTSKNGSFETSIPANKMQQMFFACPEGEVSSIAIVDTAKIPQNVQGPIKVQVEGANNYAAATYDLFYVDNATAAGGANTYTVTVNK